MKRLLCSALIVAASFALARGSLALESVSFREGQVLTATGDVNLRDSYPAGLFYTKGKILGVVRAAERVRVVSTKSLWGFFTSYSWIQIERLSPPANEQRFGWVYAGEPEQPLFKAD